MKNLSIYFTLNGWFNTIWPHPLNPSEPQSISLQTTKEVSMKLFTLLLSLTLSFSIFASTSKLGALIDEHQYFITVEWDQKDRAAYEDKSQEFGRRFSEILATEKLSRAVVMEMLKSKLLNPKVAERLNVRMSLLPENPGPEALRTLVEETKKDLYAQGASWNGEIDWVATGAIVATVLLIGFAAWYGEYRADKKFCDADPTAYGCKDFGTRGTYVCTEYADELRCTSTSTTNYFGDVTTNQTCRWEQVCVGGYYEKD